MSDSGKAQPYGPGIARAVWDAEEGVALASVEVAAPPERVFKALASSEVTAWWVRPGVFDTREWMGDVRVGGHWRASGIARGRPYALEGEFLEVDMPRKLVHTWRLVGTAGAPGPSSTVTYVLESTGTGTRITLRHNGINDAQTLANTAIGWETSFHRLRESLSA